MMLEDLSPSIAVLNRDLRAAASTLTPDEARYLVDTYYGLQKFRIRCNNQITALSKNAEPHDTVGFFGTQFETLENQIKSSLDKYSNAQPAGKWARAQKGIGPVIAAGLLANLSIEHWRCDNASQSFSVKPCNAEEPHGPQCHIIICETAGHFWSFAGLDPTKKWEKGQKRPWNASLKRLAWLIGESFVKVSGYPDAVYGKLYAERKAYEMTKNENGDYADQAAVSLATKNFGQDTQARKYYEQGKLPPARIHLRAERYATKIFLSHLHEVMYIERYGKEPPKPFAIAILGHAHKIEVPR